MRFGDEYLACHPKIIAGEVQRNISIKIIVEVRVPKIIKGIWKGYFRMFTPNRIPFGNVLYIKVLNED